MGEREAVLVVFRSVRPQGRKVSRFTARGFRGGGDPGGLEPLIVVGFVDALGEIVVRIGYHDEVVAAPGDRSTRDDDALRANGGLSHGDASGTRNSLLISL